jgi:dTDP-4-amino-4,6-dideoxygalactose transaminase
MKIVSNKPTITRKELEGVLDCLIHDELATGSSVKTMEAGLAEMTGQKYCLATNSLTSTYHLVFRALDLKPGDEVIMPSYCGSAPLSALSLTGASAILVDNEENSLFPSPEMIKSLINGNTRAVIIAHTFGFHFPAEALQDITVPVIEDISHAICTEYNDVPVGKNAAFAVSSFAPSMIITTGNGGAVLTNNSKHFSAMRDLRGGESFLNLDYSMTDLQGAMGISQLLKLKEFLKRRREIARKYTDAIRITSHRLLYPYSDAFAYQTFPVIFDAPAEMVQKYWKKSGVETVIPVAQPLHLHMNLRGLDFPNADRLSKKLYTLPLYPTLTKKETELISKLLASFI